MKSVNTSLTKTWRGGQKNQHMSTMMTLSGYTLLVERNPSLFNFAGWRKEKNLTWKLPGMRRPTAQSSVWGVLHFNAIRFNRLNFPSYPPTSKALINIRHNLASGALHNINLSRDFQFIIHWRMMSCDFFFVWKKVQNFYYLRLDNHRETSGADPENQNTLPLTTLGRLDGALSEGMVPEFAVSVHHNVCFIFHFKMWMKLRST